MAVPRQSYCESGAGLLLPGFESVGPDHMIGTGCKSEPERIEVPIDERVGGEGVRSLLG